MEEHAKNCASKRPMYDGDKGKCDCDGYHTFTELYEHRHRLFIALMKAHPEKAWHSKVHSDGSIMEGWFIAGIHTKNGDITYHLPMRFWDELFYCKGDAPCVTTLEKAPEFDGHTSEDVLQRLKEL